MAEVFARIALEFYFPGFSDEITHRPIQLDKILNLSQLQRIMCLLA